MSDNLDVHWNGNMLCVIDIETTGLNPELHDIIDICVMPVNHLLEMRADVGFFNVQIRPDHPENIDPAALEVSKTNLREIMIHGMDSSETADMFVKWIERDLGLPKERRLMMLAHNWPFERAFLMEWLGPKTMDAYISGHYRDTMSMGLYLNDRYAFQAESVPFPKVGLTFMATRLKSEIGEPHTALGDCITTLNVYRELCSRRGGF